MTLIRPKDAEHRFDILSNLTTSVFRRSGIKISSYDAEAVTDVTGNVHWGYVFDEHESRIYRTQNGVQRMANLAIEDTNLIDLDHVESQMKAAIEKLMIERY